MITKYQKHYEGGSFSGPADKIMVFYALSTGEFVQHIGIHLDRPNTESDVTFTVNFEDVHVATIIIPLGELSGETDVAISMSLYSRLFLNIISLSAGSVKTPLVWQIEVTGDEFVEWSDIVGKPSIYTEVEIDALLAEKADLASPHFTGNPTAPTPSPDDDDTSIATTGFVATAIAGFSTSGSFQGEYDCSGYPNYPLAVAGSFWVVSVAGTIGGVDGIPVEPGNAFFAINNTVGGSQGTDGHNWFVLQKKLNEDSLISTTASLINNAEGTSSILLGLYSVLANVRADRACRIRLYSKAAYRTADASRPIGTDPVGEHGLMLEVVMTAGNLDLDLSPLVILTNRDSASSGRTPYLYAAIQNLSGGTSTVQVTFTKLTFQI